MLWCRVGGDDDEWARDLLFPCLCKDLEAAAVGELEIAHDEVIAAREHCLDPRRHRVSGGDLVPLLFEEDRQKLAQRSLIVDHQEASTTHAASLLIGSSTLTVVPDPGMLSMETVPLCSATAA